MKYILVLFFAAGVLPAQRIVVPLDGQWQIEDSVAPGDIPAAWRHRAPVPGMANLAQPPFPDVDRFDSREVIDNRVRKKVLPESARVTGVGVALQTRNYFWYRTTFRVPAHKQVALLKINKAQFATAVWLNGTKLGEHL